MLKKSLTVHWKETAEMMPVALFIQTAGRYDSSIYVDCGDRRVNAKSIMGMMTLGLDSGAEVTVVTNGEDEAEALSILEKYLSLFAEDAALLGSAWAGLLA